MGFLWEGGTEAGLYGMEEGLSSRFWVYVYGVLICSIAAASVVWVVVITIGKGSGGGKEGRQDIILHVTYDECPSNSRWSWGRIKNS